MSPSGLLSALCSSYVDAVKALHGCGSAERALKHTCGTLLEPADCEAQDGNAHPIWACSCALMLMIAASDCSLKIMHLTQQELHAVITLGSP